MTMDTSAPSLSEVQSQGLPELPPHWRWVRFSDICDRVSVGHVGPTSEYFTNRSDGICFLRSQNVRPGRIDLETAVAITPEFHRKLKKSKLQPGDILFVRVGANRGDCCVVPDGIGELNCANIVFARPSQRTGFHAYFFQTQLGRSLLLSASVGAAQGVINTGSVASMPVPLPPLPVQRRIAGSLSAYDELMENSQRRIRVLESMARALYREWFVHFRFPGHEKHPRVASPLGDIPQGWEITTLRAVTTKIGSGATPRGGKGAYKTEGIHLIRSLNIYDYTFEFADLAFIDDQQAAQLDNVTVEENDILLNITGASVARCALVPSYLLPARVNQHVAIVRADPMKASPFYLLDTINSDNRKAQLLALAQGGATREALTKDTISNFEIVLPPRPIMERYHTAASSIHKQREVLLRQTQNLRRTRDLLLPRLLSGQLNLKEN